MIGQRISLTCKNTLTVWDRNFGNFTFVFQMKEVFCKDQLFKSNYFALIGLFGWFTPPFPWNGVMA